MAAEPGFYQKLYDLIVTDPDILRYRSEIDKLRAQQKAIRDKAEAQCKALDPSIKEWGARETKKRQQISKRFLALRRKELGLKPSNATDDRP